eukprot:753134-Hanusia_phi.AAC.1
MRIPTWRAHSLGAGPAKFFELRSDRSPCSLSTTVSTTRRSSRGRPRDVIGLAAVTGAAGPLGPCSVGVHGLQVGGVGIIQ